MNAVILSFDSNEKRSVICERNSLTMKHMGAVESDIGKISCTRLVKERQKPVSELCMGRNKTMCMASMRESRDSF